MKIMPDTNIIISAALFPPRENGAGILQGIVWSIRTGYV